MLGRREGDGRWRRRKESPWGNKKKYAGSEDIYPELPRWKKNDGVPWAP
jgi:hypothetical protein